jgi:hypothetical protein
LALACSGRPADTLAGVADRARRSSRALLTAGVAWRVNSDTGLLGDKDSKSYP